MIKERYDDKVASKNTNKKRYKNEQNGNSRLERQFTEMKNSLWGFNSRFEKVE